MLTDRDVRLAKSVPIINLLPVLGQVCINTAAAHEPNSQAGW